MRPHDEDLNPEEIGELGTLLVAERPRPTEAFAAELDARVASRFAAPPSEARSRSWLSFLQRPLLPAAATTLAVGLIAVVVAFDVNGGGGTPTSLREGAGDTATSSAGDAAEPAPSAANETFRDLGDGDATAGKALPESALTDDAADEQSGRALRRFAKPGAALSNPTATRKVERAASMELGAPEDRVDDVAQAVLGTVARFDGIVDQSSIASGVDGGGAHFELRIPADRLQQALAALSRLPDAHVLSRSDEAVDVNQAYVSIRRRLANARAQRAGIVNALKVATSEDEILNLEYRLDAVERTIAQTERAQRGLDRRIDFSRVTLSVRADEGSGDDDGLTLGSAFDDAGRVLEVAAAVVVIAAAALVPLAILLALAWPLTRALQRRRREQALDAAA